MTRIRVFCVRWITAILAASIVAASVAEAVSVQSVYPPMTPAAPARNP